MIYLIDTDTVNYILKQRQPVVNRFRTARRSGSDMLLSSVVHFEVTRYLKLIRAFRLLRDYDRLILSWSFAAPGSGGWDLAADLWALRHAQGRPIEDADLLIAVTARQAGATLVTNDVSHYDLLGVAVENWAADES